MSCFGVHADLSRIDRPTKRKARIFKGHRKLEGKSFRKCSDVAEDE